MPDPTNKPSELADRIRQCVVDALDDDDFDGSDPKVPISISEKIDALLSAHCILTPAGAETIRNALRAALFEASIGSKPLLSSALALLPAPAGEGTS